LANAQDRDFERAVLPYIHAIWPGARISPARKTLDRAGIDIYVGTPPHFDVVVQCKGFLERELLDDQLSQCRKSIQAFHKSSYSTGKFYLLHNRHQVSRQYQDALESLLRDLEPGHAIKATLWNQKNLLIAAFDAMLPRVRHAIAAKTKEVRQEQELAERILGADPLKKVPVAVSELRIDASRLRSTTEPRVSLDDPLRRILRGTRRRIGVLIAPAGFGKTTTAMRALREHSDFCVVLPAARIGGAEMANARAVLEAALDANDVVREAQPEDRATWLRMVGPILKYLTQSEKKDMVLIIDALDESPAFERSHNLHRFFNLLGHAKIPIVVTMRTEFWAARRGDFDASLGEGVERESTTQTLEVVELRSWGDEQIVAAATSFQSDLTDPRAIRRVGQFIENVGEARYEQFYGDIPRTPLFLKFILDVLQEQDVEKLNRADLIEHWVRLKIVRDVVAPSRFGGARLPIRSDLVTSDDTVALSFTSMRAAALTMCRRQADRVELLPSCTFDAVRRAMGVDAPDSPTSLMLNSVLIPTADRQIDGTQLIRFAHRMFQEFFLASALIEAPDALDNAMLPEAVANWLDRLSSRRFDRGVG
jgi:hypothetical protein